MLEVLKSKKQINTARKSLKRMGRSVLDGWIVNVLRKMGVFKGLSVGDPLKSWDVALTLDFIDAHLPNFACILDLGAYCSEVPVSLSRMGFGNVYGVDINPKIKCMPHADKIHYCVSDYMDTPFPAASFDAITAISVIEHGYDPERLFAEVGRLLRPGGYFIASFDYWPERIDTMNVSFFDLSWLIFSAEDVQLLLDLARLNGFSPAGEICEESLERPIHCKGFDYTFAWLVLRKDT
ncbi:Methyltransferase domain protein [anaerobic digester metagenome]